MNDGDPYATYSLCREMIETVDVFAAFQPDRIAFPPAKSDRILLSGEGSSRILPAKQARAQVLRAGWPLSIVPEGANQACEYELSGYDVFIASNSGRTAEAVRLAEKLKGSGTTAMVAHSGSLLASLTDSEILLSCGAEQAVAATKSVVEQALVYLALVHSRAGVPLPPVERAVAAFKSALTMKIDASVIDRVARAPVIYFAGRNDGVAEELALKTNEITRKRSAFLEGTFAVHGIEEVMDRDDVVVVVEPFESEGASFDVALRQGVGLDVIAISVGATPFETIGIGDGGAFSGLVQLAAGWNLLVEVGLASGVDLDHPSRARKVGNEYSD